MCKDSHINQVSFTTHRHPTEYLRCDIHHVDDMQPQKAYSQTKTHPLPKSQKSNTPPTLTPKEEPCVINALGGQAPFSSS